VLEIFFLNRTENATDYLTVSVNDRGCRQRFTKREPLHIGCRSAEPNRKVDFSLPQERRDCPLCTRFISGRANDLNTLRFIAPPQLGQDRHFFKARDAPGCPKVQHNYLPAILSEALLLFVETLQGEICFVVSGLGCVLGSRRNGCDSRHEQYADASKITLH
jgi:hypothetical protein